jgi:hypothetical protein
MGPGLKETLPELTRIMSDPKHDNSIFAAEAIWIITKNSPRVLPVLIPELKKDIRNDGLMMLIGEMGSQAKDAIPIIFEHLNTEPSLSPEYAFTALWEIGKASLPSLIKLLDNEEAEIRKMAVIAIGMIGADAQAAVPEFEKKLILTDLDKGVREEAKKAVRRIKNRVKGPLPDPQIKVDLDTSKFPRELKLTIYNLCPEEIRIWKEGGSPGRDVYSFMIKDTVKGYTYKIEKEQIFNMQLPLPAPPPYEIPINGKKDIVFDFKDGTWVVNGGWAIPNDVVEKGKGKLIRAELNFPKCIRARTDRVIIGNIKSEWMELK